MGQVQTSRRVVSTSSDYLLTSPQDLCYSATNTAPLSADVTHLAYLASMPCVIFGLGGVHFALRFASNSFAIFISNFRLGMSRTISSPSSTIARGPPTIASGDTCPIQGPWVPPEKRPSVTSATDSPKPIPTSAAVGANISLIPGPPRGPSYRITTTIPSLTCEFIMAFIAASSLSNTFALPRNCIIFADTALCLITAPLGDKFPYKTAIPPSL